MYIDIKEFFDDQIIITPLLQLIVMFHGIFSGRDTLYGFLEYLTFIKQHNMYNFYGTTA